jgi:hypothetical protein
VSLQDILYLPRREISKMSMVHTNGSVLLHVNLDSNGTSQVYGMAMSAPERQPLTNSKCCRIRLNMGLVQQEWYAIVVKMLILLRVLGQWWYVNKNITVFTETMCHSYGIVRVLQGRSRTPHVSPPGNCMCNSILYSLILKLFRLCPICMLNSMHSFLHKFALAGQIYITAYINVHYFILHLH